MPRNMVSGAGVVKKLKEVVHRHGIHVRLNRWVCDKGLDLRAKMNTPSRETKVEWFYPDLVTYEIAGSLCDNPICAMP